jgi:hypothetical protein
MVTSKKIIRNNKKFLKQPQNTPITYLNNIKESESPLQFRVAAFIKLNQNCTISMIYKGLPDQEQGGIRRAIRRMVEGHRVIQTFSIPSI